MSYRTQRPPVRRLLVFGVGATLAITQLGAGCVPASRPGICGPDASVDDAGHCVSEPAVGTDSGGDAK